jgi:oligopeptidase B
MPRRCLYDRAGVGAHNSPRASLQLAWLPILASMMLPSMAILVPAHVPPAHARELRPPAAERRPVVAEHHGVHHSDDYAWLRTAKLDEVLQHPEALERPIMTYLEAENAYARNVLAPNRALQRQLLTEMRGRLRPTEQSVPEARGPWQYYTRYPAGAQRRLHCRRPRGGGPEQVLLDENALARGRRAFSLNAAAVSPDHALLAYALDDDGSERNTLKVRDLGTGRDLQDTIVDVRGGSVWSLDGRHLFYVRRDPVQWGRAVYRHALGTAVAADQLVYEEVEEGFAIEVRKTLSDRFMVVEAGDFSTTDVRLVDLADLTLPPQVLMERKRGVKFAVTDLGNRLIVATNADGATDGKIGEKELSAPAAAPLQDIVPHRPGRIIEDVIVFREYLVWLERDRELGNQHIFIRRWSDGQEHALDFGTEPMHVEILAGLEQGTQLLRYTYQTMAQPKQTFEYHMATGQLTLRKVHEVPSGHDPEGYVTRRIDAPAQDGTMVPASLLYRRNAQLDGSAPIWLEGYGAYGDKQNPDFGIERLSLVDRGFIYAIAHVRGGGEKGDPWHDAGRLANKLNTFTDYIAVVEQLIRLGLARPGRIVASGASAGGTLVGAAVNMRPDLFGAVYAEVPFVDCLNTLLDRTLPLTEASFSEFGNPSVARADFLSIQSYAPYENVRAQIYPPMLIVQSLNDARVPYWEAAKWTAKLRRLKSDANPVVLLTKMRGGHAGGSGRFDSLEDYARAYAFALATMGRT